MSFPGKTSDHAIYDIALSSIPTLSSKIWCELISDSFWTTKAGCFVVLGFVSIHQGVSVIKLGHTLFYIMGMERKEWSDEVGNLPYIPVHVDYTTTMYKHL